MFDEEIENLKKQQLFRTLFIVEGEQDTSISIQGKRLISLASNNYLGLANHPLIKQAAIETIQTHGLGAGASRFISGNSYLYHLLEEKISRFKDVPAAVVFSSGFATNISVIPALTQHNGIILADELNHASLFEGCRLSRANVRIYKHGDMNHLEKLLKKYAKGKFTLIVTDGVFSMDGDLAPLPILCSLAKKFDARVLVDDAHGTGILGSTGKGIAEHFGIEALIDYQMGTFSKALGTFGGFIGCTQRTRTYLLQKAKSLIFSTALPPVLLAASIASIEIAKKNPERRKQLWENRNYFIQEMKNLGFRIPKTETPIIPVLVGTPQNAMALAQGLFEKGIFAPAIRPPTVPKNGSRIRTTVMATHTRSHLDLALTAFSEVGKKLGLTENN